ncbi:carbohydrate-binding protein [Roseibacillus persicicus]|uniref:carbohydrate-binding protein n=1 Tax=Roseibacillus persicicus TaxID=454148 RepID=UPI00398A7EF9
MKRSTLFVLPLVWLSLLTKVSADANIHAEDDLFWQQAASLLPNYTAPPSAPSVSTRAGKWGPVIDWPHTPVTIAVLPNGKLLTYAGQEPMTWPGTAHQTNWALWNPDNSQFASDLYQGHEMFCAHPVMRTDGILQTMGGRFTIEHSSTYDWRSNSWNKVPDMNGKRWYTTAVALSDGDVVTFGGQGSPNTVERFDYDNQQWNLLSGINWQPVSGASGFESNGWPFLMVAPDGRLFHFGPTDTMHWVDASGNGSRTSAGVTVPGNHYPHDGGIVMYGSGKYLIVGGAANPNSSTASKLCYTVDLNTTPPTVETTGSMAFARSLHNIVSLPSGEVVAIGGNTTGLRFSDGGSILPAEVWNPATGTWRTLSSMAIPRNYHSTAALLPDGRVYSGGGGYLSNNATSSANHPDAQIFTPPALLDASNNPIARPTITEAPEAVALGSVFEVSASAGLNRFSMTRMIAITHGVTSDQRFLDIPFTETSPGTYQLISHPNKDVMVPGYWMLFATQANGAYSEAKIIHVKEASDSDTSGLLAQYFDGTNFQTLKEARTDALIDFTSTANSPLPDLVGNGTYSVRWTGWIIPEYSEDYTFYTQSDDGVRLWVDNQQIINNWNSHSSTEDSATITLQAGVPVPIRLDYYQNTNGSTIQLKWSSPRTSKAIVPSGALRSVEPRNEATIASQNRHELYIDGQLTQLGLNSSSATTTSFSDETHRTIAIHVTDVIGSTGLLGHLRVNGEVLTTSSDWKVSHTAPSGWEQPEFDDSAWAFATEHGDLASAPWAPVSGFPKSSPAKWIWSSDLDNRNGLYLRIKVGELSLAHQPPVNAFLNTTLNHSISANGGVPPYTFSVENLPQGLTLNPSSGLITGQPTLTGTGTVTITVTDSEGQQVVSTQPWTIHGSLLFEEDFESDDGGFSYRDDAFRSTNNPAYAKGSTSIQSRVGGDSLQALYTFEQGAAANTVYDLSGNGTPLNLTIANPSLTSWNADGSLSVTGNTLIQSTTAASKLHQAITGSNAMALEAWVRPQNLTQAGPARIATLSSTTSLRNFTVGQEGLNYHGRLRTPQTSTNGLPGVETTSNPAALAYQHVVYTISDEVARLYVNGVMVKSASVPGTFSNWDSSFQFALANELTGDRPWLGDFDLLAVYSKRLTNAEIATNYQAGRAGSPIRDGRLNVELGGVDTTTRSGMSGAWERTIQLTQQGTVVISPQWRLDASTTLDSDESSEVLVSLNSQLLGLNGNDYLIQNTGGGDSGYQTSTVSSAILPAGNHTLRLGAHLSKKNDPSETAHFELESLLVTFIPDENEAPTLSEIPDLTHTEGTSISYLVSGADADNDPLTYRATGLPAGLTIDPNSGRITGRPTSPQSYTPIITVSDPDGEQAARTFSWTIHPIIDLPETLTSPSQSGSATTFNVGATGGTHVTYAWNFGDGTPEVTTGNPTASHVFSQPGRYTVSLTATDANGDAVTRRLTHLVHPVLTASRPRNSQPVITVVNGTSEQIWNVNPDQDTVSVFDLPSRSKLAEIPVGDFPRTLSLAPDGRVWVSNKTSSTLSIIDPNDYSVVTRALPRGAMPHGIVHSPNGDSAWVALEALGEVAKLHPTTGAIQSRHPVGDFPRHLAINHDGSRLYLPQFISPPAPGESTGTPDLSTAGGYVTVMETVTASILTRTRLQASTESDFAGGGRGLPNYLGAPALSPTNDSAWIPSKLDNIERGVLRDGLQLDHQNSVRSISSRIDLSTNNEDYLSRIDHDNSGLPSAAIYGPYGLHLFIALEGSREVVVVDVYGGQELFRLNVELAPQGLALSPDGHTLYVHNFMSRSLTCYDLSALVEHGTEAAPTLASLDATSTETLPAQILLGKQFFYDSEDDRLSMENYMSCASCHNEEGHDGRTWDFTGFGEGLRNTIDLRGRGGEEHGPLHWSANFDEFQDFEGQIRSFAKGTGLLSTGTPHPTLGSPNGGRSEDLDALAAYLSSLTEVPQSPHRSNGGELTAAALAGKDLFLSKGCADCHSGTAFTDSGSAFHDIGTITAASGQRLNGALPGFDTPSLLASWAGSPYLHDGSENTLAGAITAHEGVSVTPAELESLVAYLNQLEGNPDEIPAQSLAHGGTPAPVPGRIEAENYDTGGPGVSYSDTDPENFGANFGENFRAEGVDLEASLDTANTPAIGWIEDGEWTSYTVALTPGTYDLAARAASELNIPGSIRVLLDDAVSGEIDIASTGGWYAWEDFVLPNLTISEGGTAVLRLEFQGASFNLNWVEFREPGSGGGPGETEDDQTPFGGPAALIPGRVEAENFDDGGPGVAYLDSEEENFGFTYTDLNYRPGGVDIEASFDSPSTPSVGWTDPGEWMEYTVNVTPGTYDLKARVASGFALPGGLSVELNGRALGTFEVAGTGDWYQWETVTIPAVEIVETGLQVLRLKFTGQAGFNLNWIEIGEGAGEPPVPEGQNPFGGTAHLIPGRVEAENYDLGGQGVAYSDAEEENLGGAYRTEGVDIEPSGDTEGGYSVGWFDDGQWMEYTVQAPTGIYQLNMRVASAESVVGDVRVTLDGEELGIIDVQSTGGWANWVTLSLPSIPITSAGQKVIRLEMIGDAVNLNWFELVRTDALTNLSAMSFQQVGLVVESSVDSDGDNSSNLAEFAFGSHSGQANSRPVIPVTVDEEGRCCQTVPVAVGGTLGRNTYTAAGLVYTFQGSRDLANWDEPIHFVDNPSGLPTPPTGYHYLTYRLADHSLENGYLRVLVEEE